MCNVAYQSALALSIEYLNFSGDTQVYTCNGVIVLDEPGSFRDYHDKLIGFGYQGQSVSDSENEESHMKMFGFELDDSTGGFKLVGAPFVFQDFYSQRI